ncbi:MAG: magnesium transporter [Magnetococcales bacterium]|nr:magnesium transporter [Magnetococcales bacterium]
MAQDRISVLLETVTRLYRKQSLPYLENLLNKTSENDLTLLFRMMRDEESVRILPLLPRAKAARILRSLSVNQKAKIISLSEVRDLMPTLEEFPAEELSLLLGHIDKAKHGQIQAILNMRQRPVNLVDDRMMGKSEVDPEASMGSDMDLGYSDEVGENTGGSSTTKHALLNQEKVQMLQESIERLFAKKATRTLQNIFARVYPVDLAGALEILPEEDVPEIFWLIPGNDQKARVLGELNEQLQEAIVSAARPETLLPILERLAPDRRTDLFSHLDKDVAESLINQLDQETKTEVENLLKYPPESAGGIMTSQFFALPEDTLVSEAIAAVRTLPAYEMVFYLYVVDESGRLTGVSSLRQLLLAHPNKPLREMMNTRVVQIYTHTPQSDVVEMVRHYRLLGVPVVDEMGVMVGLVTVDDLFPIFEDEVTEDMLKMAGAHHDEIEADSSLPIVRIRLPWLLLVFLGGVIGVSIYHYFQKEVMEMITLIFFLPVVTALAGNVGNQSATVVVRGLSTGEMKANEFWKILLREVGAGALLGLLSGILLGLTAWLMFRNLDLVQVVATAATLTVTLGSLIATTIPLILVRKGGDPTSLTGPMLTTTIDVAGIASYFLIAKFFID